jgi:hypothetical protein
MQQANRLKSALPVVAITRTAGFSLEETDEIVSINVNIKCKIINWQEQVAI